MAACPGGRSGKDGLTAEPGIYAVHSGSDATALDAIPTGETYQTGPFAVEGIGSRKPEARDEKSEVTNQKPGAGSEGPCR